MACRTTFGPFSRTRLAGAGRPPASRRGVLVPALGERRDARARLARGALAAATVRRNAMKLGVRFAQLRTPAHALAHRRDEGDRETPGGGALLQRLCGDGPTNLNSDPHPFVARRHFNGFRPTIFADGRCRPGGRCPVPSWFGNACCPARDSHPFVADPHRELNFDAAGRCCLVLGAQSNFARSVRIPSGWRPERGSRFHEIPNPKRATHHLTGELECVTETLHHQDRTGKRGISKLERVLQGAPC